MDYDKNKVAPLQELGVRAGDVVQCVETPYGVGNFARGSEYTVSSDLKIGNKYGAVEGKTVSTFRIVSREVTFKKWGDMTDAEKGVLLLADHMKKAIQFKRTVQDGWIGGKSGDWLWRDQCIYRIKPEPVRTTIKTPWTSEQVSGFVTHQITVETVDGVVDCSTVKMEKLS